MGILTFLGEDNSTFGLSMSNVQQNNTITPNPVMQHETFHTPSLGDEEFDIPPITPPQIAMEAMSTSMTDPNTAPALTEPMTSPSPTFTHDSNPKFTQAHITETADSLPNPAMETFPDPQFPPQTIDIPPITASNCSLGIDTVPCAVQSTGEQSYSHTLPMTTFAMTTHPTPSYIHDVHIPPPPQHVQSQVSQLSTINQSAISSHLGLQVGMRHGIHMVDGRLSKHSPSPPTTSPIPHESSEDSDDNTPLSQVVGTLKRTAVEVTPPPPKKKTPKKKKKKDPNEPQKPVSAYALFFRDTQAAIKGQNPNASFGEVSKIVASMWDSLGVEQKQVYKQNTEAAKKEYLKKLAAYRASLVSKAAVDQAETEDVSSHKQKKMTVTSNTLTSANTTTTMIQSIPRIIAPKPTPTASMPITVTMTTVARSASQQPVVQTIITNPKLQPHMVHTNERKRSATCMRVGCENPAVESPDWDKEYCSNECVVSHCRCFRCSARDVFTAWVASRNPNIFPSVK